MTAEEQTFAQKQANAAKLKRVLLSSEHARESAEASAFLLQFVQSAREAGLPSEPLMARGYGGKGSAKTSLKGWYLKADRSLGVDTDGNYYILTKDLSLLDRVRGVMLKPTAPPLTLGKGGRDGESMDLTAKLDELLPKWRRVEGR